MKNLILSFISVWLFTFGFSQNLLLNGSAESGDLSSWTYTSNSVGATTQVWQPNDIVNPQEGDYFFTFHNDQAVSALILQQGILDIPSGELSLSGYFHGEYWADSDLDFGEVILSLHDSNNTPINSVSTGEIVPENPSDWIEFTLALPVESNSYSWKVVLKGNRLVGNFINVYYDNIILTMSDPASINGVDIKDNAILYPNPLGNTLFIRQELSDLKEIIIYTITGNIVVEILTINSSEIDISNISSGNYLAVGSNKNNEIIFREKIIKK